MGRPIHCGWPRHLHDRRRPHRLLGDRRLPGDRRGLLDVEVRSRGRTACVRGDHRRTGRHRIDRWACGRAHPLRRGGISHAHPSHPAGLARHVACRRASFGGIRGSCLQTAALQATDSEPRDLTNSSRGRARCSLAHELACALGAVALATAVGPEPDPWRWLARSFARLGERPSGKGCGRRGEGSRGATRCPRRGILADVLRCFEGDPHGKPAPCPQAASVSLVFLCSEVPPGASSRA